MRNKVVIVLYIALAVSLSAIETVVLPTSVIPGAKLGFANLVVLVTAYQFGLRAAYVVSFVRVVIVSLVLGVLLTPTFFISVAGMLCSLVALTFAMKSRVFSIVGVSVVSSVFHIIGQVIAVMYLLDLKAIVSIAPFLIYVSLLTGAIIGYIAKKILKIVKIKAEVLYEF